MEMVEEREVVILGGGPAGLTAALYTARAELKPLLFEGLCAGPAGGQLMTTTEIENFPGFPEGIAGPELMARCRSQAVRFGAHIVTEDALRVDLSSTPFTIWGQKTTVRAEALIIATGATAKRLDIPGAREGEFWQKGVTACAICDGAMPLFRNKDLYVVGGGDTAVEEALFLTKYGSRVYIVHRREELRASKIMAQEALHHPKIEVLWNRLVVEVTGERTVTHLTLEDVKTKVQERRPAGGLFFAIGHTPNTGFLKEQLHLDTQGYIVLAEGGTSATSRPGVFAAGDVYDHRYRQAITAAGSGCMAALDVERWLREHRRR